MSFSEIEQIRAVIADPAVSELSKIKVLVAESSLVVPNNEKDDQLLTITSFDDTGFYAYNEEGNEYVIPYEDVELSTALFYKPVLINV